jgi:transcriptional regulator with XRE-family HTH domain
MSIRTLARLSGASIGIVSEAERGRPISERMLVSLASALNVSPEVLLETPVDHLEVVSGLADRGVLV